MISECNLFDPILLLSYAYQIVIVIRELKYYCINHIIRIKTKNDEKTILD